MPIPVDLGRMLHKGQSVGGSEGFRHQRPVTIDDLLLKQRAVFYVGDHVVRGHKLPEMMLEVAFVRQAEELGAEPQQLLDVLVFDKRFPDVVRLRARVLSA